MSNPMELSIIHKSEMAVTVSMFKTIQKDWRRNSSICVFMVNIVSVELRGGKIKMDLYSNSTILNF
jgi:hypothetical protein